MPQTQDQTEVESAVRAHAGWVYSCAKRRVRDDALAEDVTQAVFILFWQKRVTVWADARVTGWLYRAVRYCAGNALRLKHIRERHEREAAMAALADGSAGEVEVEWSQVSPELEWAVDRLRDEDRSAVLLRFYRQMSFAEVGQALGVSEEAAKKRVQRAVEKLRGVLAKKGVVAGAGALGVVMAEKVTAAAPVGLVEAATAAAGAGGTGSAGVIAKGAVKMMAWAKMKAAAISVAATIGLAGAGVVAVDTVGKPEPDVRPKLATTTPTMGEFYMLGVPEVGVYPVDATRDIHFPTGRRITLKQALVRARTDLTQASAQVVMVIRRSDDGQSESKIQIAVSTLSGERDFPMQANDLVLLQDPNRAIEAGDRLRVSIGDLVAPNAIATFNKVVDRDGQLHLPLVPAMKVAGLSFAQAQRAVAAAYKDANLIREADNEVVRMQPNGQWLALSPLRAGDWLLVRIWDLEAPTLESRLKVRISPEGTIVLPSLKTVKVGGMEDYEAEAAISKACTAAHVIQNAALAVERATDGSPAPKEDDRASSQPVAIGADWAARMPPIPPTARTVRAEFEGTWKKLLDGWSSRPSAASIAMDYEITGHFAEPRRGPAAMVHGYVRVSHKVSYARSGRKYFQRCESETERSDSIVGHGEMTCAFDGEMERVRGRVPGCLLVGKSPMRAFQLPPLPDEFIRVIDPAKLQQLLGEGRIEILDVSQAELEGKQAIRLEYRSSVPSTPWTPWYLPAVIDPQFRDALPGTRVVAWYSPAQGYLQIREQWYDPDGNLVAESGLSEVEPVTLADGKSLFYPLAVFRRELIGGKESMRAELKVARTSLRVNQPLADSMFVLQPGNDERVVSMDR